MLTRMREHRSFAFLPRHGILARALLAVITWAAVSTGQPAVAQPDRVYQTSGPAVIGRVSEMDRRGVTVEATSGDSQAVSLDRISRIAFGGEPQSLTRGRDLALDGQFDQALDELRKVEFSAIQRAMIRADAMYYLASSEAEMALMGRGDLEEAKRKLNQFARGNSNNIHFFAAARLLGNLAVATGKHDDAIRYYTALAQAQQRALTLQSDYLIGRAHLRKGSFDEAIASLDKVIGGAAETAEAVRFQTMAKAGKAEALARSGKPDEALQLVDELIAELDPVDSEVASRIYNAQGAGFEANGDLEGAVLAYLHTHLMFSGNADAHAESLTRLVDLWPEVGKPDRGNQARQELRQRYPGWKP